MSTELPERKISKLRLYLGVFFFALSWLMPVFGLLIAGSNMAPALKAVMVGLVSIGGPEIIGLVAIAILGKDCFELLSKKLFSFAKKLAPRAKVGPIRYRLGLIMFVLPLVPWYVIAYAPQWLPDGSSTRLYVCLLSDLCFWSSLFVLGGDFWDKLRSLFIYEAKAMIPSAPPQPTDGEAAR